MLTTNRLPCHVARRFRRNAWKIDHEWDLPQLTLPNIQQLAHATNKDAKQHLHQALNFRTQHLEEQRLKQVKSILPSRWDEAIKRIIKKEEMKNRHKAINNRLKIKNAPLTFIVDKDGTRKTDTEMINAIINHNAEHFAQARTNGASAA